MARTRQDVSFDEFALCGGGGGGGGRARWMRQVSLLWVFCDWHDEDDCPDHAREAYTKWHGSAVWRKYTG